MIPVETTGLWAAREGIPGGSLSFQRLFSRLLGPRTLQTLSSLDAYAQWAASYPPHAHNALMQAEEAAMLSLLPDLSGKSVLDLACGTGRYGLIARARGAATVIGLDNSAAMLRANSLPHLVLSTSEAIPLLAESIDIALCGLALGHLPSLEPSLREISRVLKPSGCALISDFHPFIFLSGQRRTFSAPDGHTYAVEHYPHLYSYYQQAADQVGLKIERVLEPRLGQDTVVRFADAATATGTPVVIVYYLARR
jgi:malonyl-CoA O-methyltransferase